SDGDVQLAVHLRPEARPVPLQDGAEIVVITPVLRDIAIDDAGLFVEQRARVAIGPYRTEHRIPDIELLPRAAARAERELVLVDRLRRRECASEVVTHAWLYGARVRALRVERVLVLVHIDIREA